MDQENKLVEILVDLIDKLITSDGKMNREYNKYIGREDCINRSDTIILLIYSYYKDSIKSEYMREQIMRLARIRVQFDYFDYVQDNKIDNENNQVLKIDDYINNVWLKYEENITEYYGGNSSYNMYGIASIILRKLINEINK